MSRRTVRLRSSGLTLVEMLVAVAIIGILMAVAAPSLSSMMERRRVIAAAGELANMLAFAQSEANVISGKINFHLEPVTRADLRFSCARLSVAPGGQDRCSCNKAPQDVCAGGTATLLREFVLPLDTSVKFYTTSATSWLGEANIATFQRVKYLDVENLQIVVEGINTGAKLRVNYNNAGRVSICSPDARVGGYQAC